MKDEVSLRLEGCLLRFMDQLELLEEKRQQLNSLIEQGWFSISKARYAMGNKQVSALQYSSEIVPQVSVHVRTLPNGETGFETEQMGQQPSGDAKDAARRVEEVGPVDEGVRRRKAATAKNSEDHSDSSTKPVAEEELSISKVPPGQQDPLKWFGILVPQSLKQAQSAFRQVIELSAEIASLQTAVLSTRKELHTLMGEKHKAPTGKESSES
ncbi:coiled-coil domain-containing protein 115 [Arapaima gigas]